MYTYKLTRIVFNDDTEIEPSKITVIVGPNNSGKSRALKDIVIKTTRYRQQVPVVVVRDVEWTMPQNLQELCEVYDVERYQNQDGNWSYRTLGPELCDEYNVNGGGIWPTSYEHIFQSQDGNSFSQAFGDAMIAFLNTERRLQLVKESASQSHERQQANLLQALYDAGKPAERLIAKLVKQAFGREIALDFTTLQRLLLRVGNDFDALPPDPREAKPMFIGQEKLDEQGDGIRSFVGMIVAILSSKRSLFLIDEPEAFLHPPQAYRIGEFLADQASNGRQIIIATHSADVLRGILSKTRDASILRVDRIGNTNTFRRLDPDRLNELATDPLLSSARVLDGLFYSGAVVVEADSDARFYQSASKKRRPDADLHWVKADNKQTVPRIMTLYRDMGVRCAGIVDFDVLNKRVEFEKQVEALVLGEGQAKDVLAIQGVIAQAAKEIPPDERLENVKQQMTELLKSVNETLASLTQEVSAKEKLLRQIESKCHELADSTKGWKQFKQNGQAALPMEIQPQFDRLSAVCVQKGLFINPCGELESMLTQYGIAYTTDKRTWITQALQLLPSLEVDEEKHPWKFIRAVHEFLLKQEA